MEGRHRSTGGNALRAAVLGANDGLASNLSLVMAVAGAALAGTTIVLTGLAGLVAGGISMALGEWLSVNSARELYQHQISVEKAELEAMPEEEAEEEAEELALIYEAKGLDRASEAPVGADIGKPRQGPRHAGARGARHQPESLGGSAMEAAATSFALFTMGAVVPVAPFVFLSGLPAVLASILASSAMLFAIGGLITLFTGKSILSTGLRQVVFGLAAAAITYGVGRLFRLFFGI